MRTNTYLIISDASAILIDPGGDLHEVIGFIEHNHLSLKMVVSTHGHFDHIFGVNQLVRRFNSIFMIGEGEEEIIKWSVAVSPEFFGHEMEKPEIGRLISGDEHFNTSGIDLTALNTPGHTPGSYSFILGKSIFTGDVLFKGSVGRTDFGGNLNDLKASLAKLMKLDDEFIVFPGHGERTTIGHERVTNFYVSQLLGGHL